jgi:lipopolysaccharide export LptBFGC system permease protein LptF
MQMSNNIANALGILTMTLFAIPLWMKVHRRDTASNIVIALCLCLAYYFVMAMFSLFGDRPHMRPDILVWILNVILTGLKAFPFRRALQY